MERVYVEPIIENVILCSKNKSKHLAECRTVSLLRKNPMPGLKCLYGIRVYGKHCMHKHSDGAYCSKIAFTDYMYCDKHMKKDLGLEVKESRHLERMGIDGLGLYAIKNPGVLAFSADDVIDTYRGEIMTSRRRLERYGDGESLGTEMYSANMPGSVNIIDCLCAPCAASYSNEACNIATLVRQSSSASQFVKLYEKDVPKCTNAELVSYGDNEFPVLVATKDIFDGDEILWKYGSDYWSTQHFLDSL